MTRSSSQMPPPRSRRRGERLALALDHLVMPKDGERESGDAVVVRPTDDGVVLAVIDALGHGERAAAVAREAILELGEVAVDRGVAHVIDRLHGRLGGGRGAAGLVCILRGKRLEVCGVGNVDLRIRGAKIPVALTPGVLGGAMSRRRVFSGDLCPGARLVMFSDGISARLDLDAVAGLDPAAACRALMGSHRRAHDDATVLVVDVLADGGEVDRAPSP